jgi:hypothetical protein
VLIDKNAHRKNLPEVLIPQTRYGQLKRILGVKLSPSPLIQSEHKSVRLVLAVLVKCKVTRAHPSLDIHYYPDGAAGEGQMDVLDLQCVHCAVGRVLDRREWAVIDRSGSLARALFTD